MTVPDDALLSGTEGVLGCRYKNGV